MSAALPWFAMYAGDWFAETTRLSVVARAAHVDLLCAVWIGGPVPDDNGVLARCCRMSDAEWAIVRPELARIWKIENGFWSLDWLEDQRDRAVERSEKQRAKANKRWSKDTTNDAVAYATAPPTGDAVAMPSSPSPSPSLKSTSSSNAKSPSALSAKLPQKRRSKMATLVNKSPGTLEEIGSIVGRVPEDCRIETAIGFLRIAWKLGWPDFTPTPSDLQKIKAMLRDDVHGRACSMVIAIAKTTSPKSTTTLIGDPVAWLQATQGSFSAEINSPYPSINSTRN